MQNRLSVARDLRQNALGLRLFMRESLSRDGYAAADWICE